MSARPQHLVEAALAASTSAGCQVVVESRATSNLRFAGSTLTTNGVGRSSTVTVIAAVRGAGSDVHLGSVTRSVGRVDDVAELVAEAEAAATANPAAPDAEAFVTPADTSGLAGTADGRSGTWDDVAGDSSAADVGVLAADLGDAFRLSRSEGWGLYGYVEHDVTTSWLGSSTGLRLRHVQPSSRVEMTARDKVNATRSAWAGAAGEHPSEADVPALVAELRQRLGWAERSATAEPGRQETLLSPSAVADLLIYLYWSSGGRDAGDGRTVWSAPGGGTRLGERVSKVPITLRSDPFDAAMPCSPFALTTSGSATSSVFDNGLPQPAVRWIDEGVLTSLIETRHSARVSGRPLGGSIGNVIAHGGADDTATLDEMIARTDDGLLVTCMWYIREVDPQTLLLTGLTRDGVYRVRGGEVIGAVGNFRWNESPVDLLGRITEIGGVQRTMPREWADWFTRAAMPPLRIPDFLMSTASAGV